MHRKIFYFLMILALSSSVLLAQKGRIRGKVTDLQTGEALIGATVAVVGTSYGAQTDANGEYLIQNLDPGTYQFRVSYIAYRTMTFSNVRIQSDLQTNYNFGLPSEDIQISTVEVVAERKLIQKSETSSSTVRTAEDIRALPTRDVNAVTNMTAGVTPVAGIGTTIRGSRTGQIGYYIDGVRNTNPIGNTQNMGVAFDALEEAITSTGGISAEFGNANAGVVRQNLRSGGSKLRISYEFVTANPTFMSLDKMYSGKKDLFGQYPLADHESSLSISGPILSNDWRFFTNLNYTSSRGGGQWPSQPYEFGEIFDPTLAPEDRDTVLYNWNAGPRRKNMQQFLRSTSTMNIDLNEFRIRLSANVSYNWSNTIASNQANYYNSRGNEFKQWAQNYSVRLTHILSSSMFYEVSAAYYYMHNVQRDQYLGEQFMLYGDAEANAAAGAPWIRTHKDSIKGYTGRYQLPRQFTVWDFAFNGQNTPMVGNNSYGTNKQWSLTLNATLNINIGKEHQIRLGGEYFTFRRYIWNPGNTTSNTRNAQVGFANTLANAQGTTAAEKEENVRRTLYFGGLGYDLWGNEMDDDFDGPQKPIQVAAFINDNIEYEDLVIQLGLRYDYYNNNNMKLKDPTNPHLGIMSDPVNGGDMINPDAWEKVSPVGVVSPRINIVFPISEKTRFRATYGVYVQMPQMNLSFVRPLTFMRNLNSGLSQVFSFLDMRPVRNTTYEIGFEQELTDFMAISLTGFYRDIKDEVTVFKQQVSRDCPWKPYSTYRNGDIATTKGIEASIAMRRYQRLLVNGSITYQDARGTGSNPNSNRGIIEGGGQMFVPQYIAPLQSNVPLRASINIDYRFGLDEGGPIFSGLGLSLLTTFQTGHPFTRGNGPSAQQGTSSPEFPGDARDRFALEPLNSSYTPNLIFSDLRIDKQFRIYDKLMGTVYLLINNVFDIQNEQNVYVKTGTALDDGYLSDPNEVGAQRAANGELWYQIKQAVLQYGNGNNFLSNPRTVSLGIRLEY